MAGLYEARFPIYGDKTMSWRLRETFEFSKYAYREYDPTAGNGKRGDDRPKRLAVDGLTYSVLGFERDEKTWPGDYLVLFHRITQVIIFAYDVSSKESFERLDKIYDDLPLPEQGRIRFDVTLQMSATADRYPIVLIGCKYPADNRREVENDDVTRFLRDHPGCTFAGECVPDGITNENVDQVFQVSTEILHELRKRAMQEERRTAEKNTEKNTLPAPSLWDRVLHQLFGSHKFKNKTAAP